MDASADGGWAAALFYTAVDVAAGTCGGFGQVFAGHPLDTMKVRLQTQPTENPLYDGLADCVRRTAKEEGWRGFYKGVGSPLAGMAALNALQFGVLGRVRPMLATAEERELEALPELGIAREALAGGITGLAGTLVESPVEMVKSQLQAQVFREGGEAAAAGGAAAAGAAAAAAKRSGAPSTGGRELYKGSIDAAARIYRAHGLRGLYHGWSSTAMRSTPCCTFYYAVYSASRQRFAGPDGDVRQLPTFLTFIAGGLAGVAYWLITYPLDVVKSVVQADSVDPAQRRYRGFFHAAKELYRTEGLARFTRGYSACLLRSFPANAACFLCYEQSKKLFLMAEDDLLD
eukprot:PLAT10044.1.p1 GENE.PLAT10044.1~~PLAT10044.1.p1  ORF type:complete len:345 (+),score=137.18 PLAT10044.1:20-1054(+)